MKKLKFLLMLIFVLCPVSAYAYNVVDLPEQMTLSDAMGKLKVQQFQTWRTVSILTSHVTK